MDSTGALSNYLDSNISSFIQSVPNLFRILIFVDLKLQIQIFLPWYSTTLQSVCHFQPYPCNRHHYLKQVPERLFWSLFYHSILSITGDIVLKMRSDFDFSHSINHELCLYSTTLQTSICSSTLRYIVPGIVLLSSRQESYNPLDDMTFPSSSVHYWQFTLDKMWYNYYWYLSAWCLIFGNEPGQSPVYNAFQQLYHYHRFLGVHQRSI